MGNDILTTYNKKMNSLAEKHLQSDIESVLSSEHGTLLPHNQKRFLKKKTESIFNYSEDSKKTADVFKFIEELTKYSSVLFKKEEDEPHFEDLAKRYDTVVATMYKLISDGFIKSDALASDDSDQNNYLKTFMANIQGSGLSEYVHHWVRQDIEKITDFDRSVKSPVLKQLVTTSILPLVTSQSSRNYTTELQGSKKEKDYTTLAYQLTEAQSKEDSKPLYEKIIDSVRKTNTTEILYSVLVDKKLLDVATVMQDKKAYVDKSIFYKKFLREINSQHYPNNLPLSYKFYDMIINKEEKYDVTSLLYARLDEIIQNTPSALLRYGSFIEKEERKVYQEYKAPKAISFVARLEHVIGLNKTNSMTLTSDPPSPKMIEEIETALTIDRYVDNKLQLTKDKDFNMHEIFCYSLLSPIQVTKHLISFENSEVFMKYFKDQIEGLLKSDDPNQELIINHLHKYNLIKEEHTEHANKEDTNHKTTYVPHTSLFNVTSGDSEISIPLSDQLLSEGTQIDPTTDSVGDTPLPVFTVLKNAFTQFTLVDTLNQDEVKANLSELESKLGDDVYLRDLQTAFNFTEVKSINNYYEKAIADSFKKYNAEEDKKDLSNDIKEKQNRYLQTLYSLQNSLPLSDEVKAFVDHLSTNSQHYHYQALLNNLQSYDQLAFVAAQIHQSDQDKKYYLTSAQYQKIIKMLSDNAKPADMTSVGYLIDHVEPSIKDNMYSSILSGRIFRHLSNSKTPIDKIFDYLPESNKDLSQQLLIGHCKDEFFNYITKKIHGKTTLQRKHLKKMAEFLSTHDDKLEENIIDSFYSNLSKVSSRSACNNISRVYFPLFDSTTSSEEQSKAYHEKHLGTIVKYYATSPVNASFNKKLKALLTTQSAIQQYSTDNPEKNYDKFAQYMNATVDSAVQTIFNRLYTAIITEQNAEAQKVLSLVNKNEYAPLFKEQFKDTPQAYQYAQDLSAQNVI